MIVNNNDNNNNINKKLNTKHTNNNIKPSMFTNFLKTSINNINKSEYSEHNMVDIEDILYFFSKDISTDKLIEIFSKNPTSKDVILENSKSTKTIFPVFQSLVNHIDNKYKKTPTKIYSFTNYLKHIDHEYTTLDKYNKFSGWNYYTENESFIKKYFNDDDDILHNATNSTAIENNDEIFTENRIIQYKSNKKTSCGENTFNIIVPVTDLPVLSTRNVTVEALPPTPKIICENTQKINTEKINDYIYTYINVEVNNISDLLFIVEKYPLRENIKYNINVKAVHNISSELKQLNNMIGLSLLKESIIDQIIYYIQDFHKIGNTSKDFMHTVIYGPPGTGKTEIAKIIGGIFSKLGILRNNIFKKVTRADLIAGYLGQTAIKTKNLIKECLGGVLFIDEAYALGNNEKGDSFSKECIDTLCEALSDHKDDIMVIIAGYKDELKTCFFNYNEGLESRFVWRFATQNYSSEELKEIFIKKVKDSGWKIRENISNRWFEKNKACFKNQGRDIETLFAKTKIAHSKRVFCKPRHYKATINEDDIEDGLLLYKKNENSNKDENTSNYKHMYV